MKGKSGAISDAAHLGELPRGFEKLRTWRRGFEEAPHKPLLVLYALGRLRRDGATSIPYVDVDRDLRTLLERFGPSRRSLHPEYPFWRLQHDGVWVVEVSGRLVARKGNTDPKRTSLLETGAKGAFSPDVLALLRGSPEAIDRVASYLLQRHFPMSVHSELCTTVGLLR